MKKLKTIVSDIRAQRVLPVSPLLRSLARAPLAQLPQKGTKDVEEWARGLVEDIRNAND